MTVPSGYEANKTSQFFASNLNASKGPSNGGRSRSSFGKCAMSCFCRSQRLLCAVCKELDLALRSDRCYPNRGIVSMGTVAAVPLERRADRVGERPEGQACCHRPAVVSQQHPADP